MYHIGNRINSVVATEAHGWLRESGRCQGPVRGVGAVGLGDTSSSPVKA